MRVCTIIVMLLILLRSIKSQLNRSNEVFNSVIKGVCDHYYCQSVILFYSHENSANYQDLIMETLTRLRNIFIFLNRNKIKVVITNIHTLNVDGFQEIENSILVFLGDSDRIKTQLTEKLAPMTAIPQLAWLIFLNGNIRINDFFANFNIPFNCRFMVSMNKVSNGGEEEILTEIYRINKDAELRHNYFGSWNPNTGIILPTSNLHERRNNLYGHRLQISIFHDPPTSIITMDENNNTSLEGTMGLITDTLKQSLNFTTTYRIVKVISRFENGTWIGGIGSLVDGLADILPALLIMNPDRLKLFDFSPTMRYFEYFFFSRKPVSAFSWDTFLQPFDRDIWIAVACTILLSGLMIQLILRFYQEKYPFLKIDKKPLKTSDSYLDVFGAFCSQGMPKSKITSIAIIQCTVHWTATIVLAAYSGVLISSLAVDTTLKDIRTIQEILDDKSARLSVANNTAFSDIFKYAKDETLRKIYEEKILREVKLPANLKEGIERACSEDNYSFLSHRFQAAKLKPESCELEASELIFKVATGFGIQKNSPFREIINLQIALMRDDGILDKLMEEWSLKKTYKDRNIDESVDIFRIISLIVFLIGNYIISLFFLCCEKFMFRQSAKRKITEMQKIVKQIHIVNIKEHLKTQ